MKGQLEKVRPEITVPDELIETEVVLDKERPLTEDQFRQAAFTIFSVISLLYFKISYLHFKSQSRKSPIIIIQ